MAGPDCPEARFAKSFPTTLKRLSRADFERLALYGHAVATDAESRFGLGHSVVEKPDS